MKNEMPAQPSELRQYLDVLGTQFDADNADRDVVFKTCQLIAMWAADEKKEMPDDVFPAGMNKRVARLMLSSACVMAVRIASAPQVPPQGKGPRVLGANGRPA